MTPAESDRRWAPELIEHDEDGEYRINLMVRGKVLATFDDEHFPKVTAKRLADAALRGVTEELWRADLARSTAKGACATGAPAAEEKNPTVCHRGVKRNRKASLNRRARMRGKR